MATSPAESMAALCTACNKIPWDKLAPSPAGQFLRVRELPEPKEILQSSSCRICRLISTIQPPGLDDPECFLLARRSEHIFASTGSQSRSEYNESMMLEVAKSETVYGRQGGYLNVYDPKQVPDLGVRCVDPRSIDWDSINTSLAYCRTRHRRRCKQTGPDGPIPQLRVIDCTHAPLTVIPAPDQCEYVALSYVWGSPPAPGVAGGQASCSQTVRDAIKATLALGMRYLWVDQYCIIQSDPADKKLQIAQMGRIYASSEITIIAAAGQDASYGLPGVDKIHRHEQRIEHVGTVSVIKRPPFGPEVVRTSKWASRAWTYQEAYLSRRRLFFTDHETSFLCNNFYKAESDIMNKELWAPLTRNRYELHSFGGIVPTQLGTDASRSYQNMASLMYEYSKRQLSYQSDAYDACLGVLNHLQDMDVTSVWGIPFAEIEGQICFPINWYHSQSNSRRRCFPTWSFLEWEGPLSFPVRWHSGTLYSVSLGTNKEARHPLDSSFISSFAGLGSDAKGDLRFLHLHGLVMDLSIQYMKWEGEVVKKKRKLTINGSTKPLLPLSEGAYVALELSKDTRMLLGLDIDHHHKLPTSITGVLLDGNVGQLEGSEQRAEMLLLADRGEYFERLTIVKYSFSSGDGEPEGNIVFATAGGQVLEEFHWELQYPSWREKSKYRTVIIG